MTSDSPDESKELLQQCKDGDSAGAMKILEGHNANLNVSDKRGNSLLMMACSYELVDVVKEILKHKDDIDINAVNDSNETALNIACEKKHSEIALLLLKHPEVDINEADNNGYTPLIRSCYHNLLDVVKRILKYRDVNINSANNKNETALNVACWRKNSAIALLLLKCPGVDICKPARDGDTALIRACYYNMLNVVEEMLKHKDVGINAVRYNDRTALNVACKYQHEEMAVLLLNYAGVDIQKADTYGDTPLLNACSSNLVDVVKEMLKHSDIDINAVNSRSQTALHIACEKKYTDIALLLLKHPLIDVDSVDDDDKSPLLLAAENRLMQVEKELRKRKPTETVHAEGGATSRLAITNPSAVGLQQVMVINLADKEDPPAKMPKYWSVSQHDAYSDQLRLCTKLKDPNFLEKIDEITENLAYPIPHGHALIINNQKFKRENWYRSGSEHDAYLLKTTLTNIGFSIELKNDCNKEEILKLVKQAVEDVRSRKCFFCVILSHGEEGCVFDADCEIVSIRAITDAADNAKLLNAPKIFIIQACQGHQRDEGIMSDAPRQLNSLSTMCGSHYSYKGRSRALDDAQGMTNPEDVVVEYSVKSREEDVMKQLEHEMKEQLKYLTLSEFEADSKSVSRSKDIFVAMATVEGYVSWRNRRRGSFFIQSLIYALNRWAYVEELNHLFYKVNDLVSMQDAGAFKQTAIVKRHTLTKKFYFFPGVNADDIAK